MSVFTNSSVVKTQIEAFRGAQGPVGPQGIQGIQGPAGNDGRDGVSPTVTVAAIAGGHRLTITDVDGAKTFDVMDGQDGSGGGSGAAIDDETPSATTTYSSSKIDELLNEQKEANATQDEAIGKKANDKDLAAVAKSGSYNDLSNKPTIPTVPSALKNPNALTFKGAVSATYDGSTPVEVTIPEGGSSGGSSGGGEETVIRSEETLAEGIIPIDTAQYAFTDTGLAFREILRTWKIFYIQTYTTNKNQMNIHGQANNNQPTFSGNSNWCYQCMVFFSLGKESNSVMWKRYGSVSAGNYWDAYSPAGHADMQNNVNLETIRDISPTTGLFLRNYGAAATAEIKWKVSGLMKWSDAQ